MSFIKKSASAFGKLITVIALAGTFIVGLVGVVYMSLQGTELKVPEIVGKDFVQSEKELESMGLRIKKRADRPSTEKPNTILEQLPKAGETVKTGQMILVVTSKTSPEGDELPLPIKKTTEEEESEKIEELISEKPKKSNKNTNTNKKKTRDTNSSNSEENSNSSNSNSNSNKSNSNSNKSNTNSGSNKNTSGNSNKSNSNSNKTPSTKPATGGDVRPRRTPKP